MDRLLAISGNHGQPLRSTDWEFIQNVEKVLLKAILNGLLPAETSFIVSGMELTIGNGTAQVTEGYFFDGDEISYVPAFNASEDENKRLYLVQNITTTENRVFKDATTADVWQIRRYQVVYATTQPVGSIVFNSLALIDKLTASILSNITVSSDLSGIHTLSYLEGFARATNFNGLKLQKNSLGQYMLLGAFNATVTAGKLAVLPVDHRPTGDLVGFFFNFSNNLGILKIKKDGDIYVSGAATNNTNYISFQYMITFEDEVLWGLPAGGGGGAIVDVVSPETRDFIGRAEEPTLPPAGEFRMWFDASGALKVKNSSGEVKEIQFINL